MDESLKRAIEATSGRISVLQVGVREGLTIRWPDGTLVIHMNGECLITSPSTTRTISEQEAHILTLQLAVTFAKQLE